jgi:hypothetical protein
MLKAYKEKAKTKKKDYSYNGNDNRSCCSDYRDSDCSSESSESDEEGSDSASDEDETLQVLMSMTEGMLKNARKGRPLLLNKERQYPHIKRTNIGIYNNTTFYEIYNFMRRYRQANHKAFAASAAFAAFFFA